MLNDPTKRVLFYRKLTKKFSGSNGGNLKLKDCYDHVDQYSDYDAEIFFSSDTVWSDFIGNYWLNVRDKGLSAWEMRPGDICFFSGRDWEVLSLDERNNPPVPIINVVHPRHTRKNDPRNEYLKYPAIRIVKSNHGKEILESYGVNGPMFVIPDSIDLDLLPKPPYTKDIDILIIGLKRTEMAKALYRNLDPWNKASKLKLNIHVQLPPKLPLRSDFLDLIARSKMAVCLPLEKAKGGEGFYLPPLEAMAMDTLVVTSHAIGNIDHCIDGWNCIVSNDDIDEMTAAIKSTYLIDSSDKDLIMQHGRETALQHSILRERKEILALIKKAHVLWSQCVKNPKSC